MKYLKRIKSFNDLKPGTLIINRISGTVAVITRNSSRDNDLKGFVTLSYLYEFSEIGCRVLFESKNHHWMLPELMKDYRLLTKNI